MIRRASSRWPLILLASILAVTAAAAGRAADPQASELPADGQNSLKEEYDKWAPVWTRMLAAAEQADPANTQHQQAVDAAAKWTTYRLTWGLEKDPGKTNEVVREFVDNLQGLRLGKDKTQKLGEMYVKQVIAHAQEVLQTRKPIARINAARVLARIPEKAPDDAPADVLARLTGPNQAALADALTAAINDPSEIDAARLYAFRGLQNLLALPPQTPPALPRDKEEAALGAVMKFLQDRNKPLPAGTPQDEIDAVRYVRREAIKALAQSRYPTLTDKSHPTWILLKIVARDGIEPAPRLDERVEAALGVARARPDLDPDYQPDYAAHQLGLFVVDFANRYGLAKQGTTEDSLLPWKYQASRLIEGLEFMKAQSKNAHVGLVADESMKLLTKIEKALPAPNAFDMEQKLQGEASPSQLLYKSVPDSTVKPANRAEEAAPEKPEPPAKPEEKKDK